MKLGMQVGLGPGHIVLDGDPVTHSPSPKGHTPQFSAHICCGQMAALIKMSLGMELGLGPGDFVLDRDPSHRPQGGGEAEPPPQFSAHFYCGQTAGCIGVRGGGCSPPKAWQFSGKLKILAAQRSRKNFAFAFNAHMFDFVHNNKIIIIISSNLTISYWGGGADSNTESGMVWNFISIYTICKYLLISVNNSVMQTNFMSWAKYNRLTNMNPISRKL